MQSESSWHGYVISLVTLGCQGAGTEEWVTGKPKAGLIKMMEKDLCSSCGYWQGTDDRRGI